MLRLYTFLLLLLSVIASSPLGAQESQKAEDDIPLLTEEQKAKLDKAHEDSSKWLLEKVLWFDSFFDDEKE